MRRCTRRTGLIPFFVCILTAGILVPAGFAGNSYSKKSIGINNIIDYNRVDSLNIVSDNFVLEKPTLVSPVDGTHMTGSTPTFEWENVPGADNQYLLVDNDADFSSPIDNILLGATDENWTKPAPGYSPDNYHWKIVAVKGDSRQDSDAWAFTSRNPIDYVNTLIGVGSASGTSNDNQGFCYPGVGVPFGTTQWTPQGGPETGSDFVPYLGENSITGFRGSHFPPGSQMKDYASVTVDPQAGTLKTTADARAIPMVIINNSPDYFACTLKDNFDIGVEVTATLHSSFFRLSYFGSGSAHILIDASATGSTKLHSSENEIWVKNVQHGFSDGTPENAKIVGYSVIRFNRSFLPSSGANGNLANADFSVNNGENILVKVGTSFISYEQANANLDNDIPDWDFDRVMFDTRAEWNRELGKIEVEGENENQMTIFYTALYHCMLVPRVFSENGRYYSVFDGENHTSPGYQFYDDFSLWDTFRAEDPLLTLIEPTRVADMAQSLVDMYEQGGWMPKWPNPGYSSVMIATNGDSVITDAYLEGVRNFDIENAYAALIKNATTPGPSFYEARAGIDYYKNLGYVPADIGSPPGSNMPNNEGTSCTLEYAYDDWCIAQLAKALGKENDYELFMSRAQNYRNVFDKAVGFVRGRNEDGSWFGYSFDPTAFTTDFTEGNSWQYTWFAPQDVQGLIGLMGGSDEFNQKLDQLFENTDFAKGWQYYYNHANEPSQGIAYLYDWSGQPWKTQKYVREIMDGQYWVPGDRPYSAPYGYNGLTGNEDCGQMSAWYVLSAMGFYPVCPGQLAYEIGSPIFDRVIIHLDNSYYAGDFVIDALKVSRENMYIQSATLNGDPLEKPWLTQSDLEGGHLVLEMDPENSDWGSNAKGAPPSMFTVSLLDPKSGILTDNAAPTFRWENYFVADNYEIWVDNDSDFRSPEILENTTENIYIISAPLTYDNYWWKIRAYVSGEAKPFSGTWIFSVVDWSKLSWWNLNWARRRPITVGAHPENYQIKIVIPGDILKSDYPSIRFLENENSGVLPYWIENCDNGNNATVYENVAWVRRLENGDNTIWMYFHNPGASSADNGDNVFMFFDDFGGGTGGQGALNTHKWGASSTGVDVYQTVLRLQNFGGNEAFVEHGPGQGMSTYDENIPRIIETRMKDTIVNRGGLLLSGPGNFQPGGFAGKEYACIFDGPRFWSDSESNYTGVQTDRWYILSTDLYSDDNILSRFYWGMNDSNYRTEQWNSSDKTNNWNPNTDSSNYCDKYRLRVWDATSETYYFDWFFVRKWTAIAPSVTLGSMQTLPGKPLLYSPANGAIITQTTPNLKWTIGENADNYRLLVDNDPDFSSPEVNVLLGSSDNSYTLTTPLAPENYSWKVVAINAYGQAESSVWTFVVVATPCTGTASLRLATSQINPQFLYGIYKAYVNASLTVYTGDNLHLKFLTQNNTTVENDIVIWSRTALGTQTVNLTGLIVQHDNILVGLGSPSDYVKRMKLVLTSSAGNVILDNMAWYKVVQDDWGDRISWIVINWTLHSGSQQDRLGDEISTCVLSWALTPFGPRDQNDFSPS